MKWTQGAWLVAVLAMCSADAMGAETAGAMVKASAREIPVAYQVDVVVVGGSTGAVSAAVAAAQNGAKVFLAAPRPYLGEDMCATLRLWLDEGEKPSGPLAEKLFAGKDTASKLFDVRDLVSFKYEADKPTAARHKDTDPPGVLADQRWHSASQESVQYDDDVDLTVDLLGEQELKKAGVLVYHKSDYQVESVTVFASPDKKTWKEVAVVKNEKPEQATVNEEAISLLTAMTGKTRYLRFFVKRAPGSKRVLVGEIVALKAVPPQTQPVRLFEPMHIKRTLDEALLEAKVDFLFGCLVTDVLRDADGNPCGIAMANRAGRQAVLAKAIVDATDRAWVARMAGAQAKPFPAGEQTLKRVVIGGEARTGANATARAVGQPWVAKVKIGPKGKEEVVTRSYQTIEYTLRLPMQDGSYASWAKAEQAARDLTYHPEQQFASDVLFQAPPDPIKGQKSLTGGWQGIDKLDVAAFRPAGVPRLYVLSGCADVSREQAEKLLRPTALIEMGSRIGAAAAAEAKQATLAKASSLRKAATVTIAASGDAKESLAAPRPWQKRPT
ncbi:MAG: FAD-dependent oxidoreductase, partial [Planctomycetes bacterium]|nr:FAD-dependent oxidoreductase [Planctomycetota bacterium]